MAASLRSMLKELQHVESLRRVRNWLVGLGLAVVALAATFADMPMTNPKWWPNTFAALRAGGYFLWLALPLVCIGVLLLGAGLIAGRILRKREERIP